MRIIIANYRYFIAGGPERYMFKFMEVAEKNGVECIPFSVDYAMNVETKYSKYFVSPRGNREDIMYADIKMTPHNILKMLNCTIYNFEAEKKLRKMIRDVKPDAVYVLHEINSLSPSIINAAKKEKVRVVHRISDFFMFCPKLDFLKGSEICESCIHGNYSEAIKNRCVKNSKLATLVRVMAMKLYSAIKVFDKVDAYITTCDFTKNKMIEGGIREDKITCIPTFIDTDKYVPCYENEGYFLFLGRVAAQKGVIYVVEAMTSLKKYGIKLKITGNLDNSDECRKIEKIIKEKHLEGTIEFVGFKCGHELDELIRKSIAIVNPAIWYENMPNTVIEAYAFGKPVIASRVGSLQEIVVDEKTGLLFELKNTHDLANKMIRFVENKDLAYKLGKQARELCERKYNVEAHYNKVMSLLETRK